MIKNIRYIFLFLILFAQLGMAQRLVYDQPFTVSSTYATLQGDTKEEVTPTIAIRNKLNRTIKLRWEKRKVMMHQDWHNVVCAEQCADRFEKSGTFEIGPYKTMADFQAVFRPNGAVGVGSVEIVIYDPLDRNATETVVTFSASAQNGNESKPFGSLKDKVASEGPKVFPNPAIEYFMLSESEEDVHRIEIYNVIGRKLKTYTVRHHGEKYDVSDLPKGMYMVRMMDSQNNIIRTQRVSKYNP